MTTPVTFQSKCKCSGECILQSRLSNWILKSRATDKGAAVCTWAHENVSWNSSDCYKSWNSVNTSDVQRMSWNILSPLIFCVKSTLEYFSCTQQPHTGERAKSWTSPQRNLLSFLQICEMIQEQHLSTTWVWPLSPLSQGWKELHLWNNFNTLKTDTWGKRYRSSAEEGNKVRETENSLWKKVYLSLRKQTKSKAGHICSKSEKWWSNSPLLHCLWQTVQVHFSSSGKHQKVPREDQFY